MKSWREERDISDRKATSTDEIIKVITEGKASINNVLCYQILYSHIKVYSISDSKYIKDLIALRSNLFATTLSWEYERVNNSTFGEFMIYCNCGKMECGTGYSAHLQVNGGMSTDEVEKMLLIEE